MTDQQHILTAARRMAVRRLREPVEDWEAVTAHWATTEADTDTMTAELRRLARGLANPPQASEAVQDMLDAATRAFADAGTSSERVEVVRDLLAGWYAAWPASAVTDEHEGIAHQLVALVHAAEARAAACPCLAGAPDHRHGVGGYSNARVDLVDGDATLLPSGSDEILAWMRRHGLGHGAGVGAVLAAVRADLARSPAAVVTVELPGVS